MKISAHCLVKNEEDFIWFALNSVVDYVDEMMVWDNGSTDNTISIIRSIDNPKIKFKQDPGKVAEVRQKMLDQSKADWIFILDGDEIWSESGITTLIDQIKNAGDSKDCVVVPNYMLIGDMFHYQEPRAGKYKIGDLSGHYNIRAVRITSGLKVSGTYPNEAYLNKAGIKVQDLSKERILFSDTPYLHASFLKKKKHELGISFPKDFYFPEILFGPRPKNIRSPWETINLNYKIKALVETPLKKIKRRLT